GRGSCPVPDETARRCGTRRGQDLCGSARHGRSERWERKGNHSAEPSRAETCHCTGLEECRAFAGDGYFDGRTWHFNARGRCGRSGKHVERAERISATGEVGRARFGEVELWTSQSRSRSCRPPEDGVCTSRQNVAAECAL